MRNFWILFKKDWNLITKSKFAFFIQLLLPLILLTVLLQITDNSTTKLKIGFYDQSETQSSQIFINMLKENSSMKFVPVEGNNQSQLTSHSLSSIVTLPINFEDKLLSGSTPTITFTTTEEKNLYTGMVGMIDSELFNMKILAEQAKGEKEKLGNLLSNYENGKLKKVNKGLGDKTYDQTLSLTFIGLFIFIIALKSISISKTIIEERENNTYHRILLTPIKTYQYFLSNIATNTIVIMLFIVTSLIGMKYILGIDSGVAFGSMLFLITLMGFVIISLSICIISLLKSSNNINTLSTSLLSATCLLGGCFVPISVFSEQVNRISFFTPQRWVIDAIYTLQMGGTFNDIWKNVIILCLFALAFISIAAYIASRTKFRLNV